MPLFYQKMIRREDLRANPGVLYVFGDNVARYGLLGQAAAMRGEPNAIGVATKWQPRRHLDAHFNDADFDKIMQIIYDDLCPVSDALHQRKVVIWPSDGIGTGLSSLSVVAPRVWKQLDEFRTQLEKHNV